jgi:hypothetical protein
MTGRELLANASADQLEGWALDCESAAATKSVQDCNLSDALFGAAALCRAVAEWERDKMAEPERAVHQGDSVPAALAALLPPTEGGEPG